MHPFTREFFQLSKTYEYSDLLEDTDWRLPRINSLVAPFYSELLEDTEWC